MVAPAYGESMPVLFHMQFAHTNTNNVCGASNRCALAPVTSAGSDIVVIPVLRCGPKDNRQRTGNASCKSEMLAGIQHSTHFTRLMTS